ncbi:HEPN/Toprim-associated domain-containing protein [Shinella kummerowiae]|uniref:HEPN/Toprim-associated domain-containing protein n=1 Tax=Shinella kummerowiae TaxID=417745 RepID=UPI0021B5C45F|nr:HEPN/Toprim-associated domain-containing protein [Shinella kummerowiae]MCT7667408.1 HEPN/Toprim-associated domain-containing protein [Shinella kummerowiae]
MIRLALGNFECDWTVDPTINDHSALFQECDAFPRLDEHEVDLEVEGLKRPLGQIVNRLELLGYSLEYARTEFEWSAYPGIFDSNFFSFEMFAGALAELDVAAVSPVYPSKKRTTFFSAEIAKRLGLKTRKISQNATISTLSYAMQRLSAGSILRLLAENPSNLSLDVVWRTDDVFGMQFATFNDKPPLKESNRFLLVTEGSSDASIIKRAFDLYMPEVSDFFKYVDMDKGYPFTGTGNVYNFAKGIASIGIENKVLIIYDNDAEGIYNYGRTIDLLENAKNIAVMLLPQLPLADRTFKSVGPDGQRMSDIDASACAIECYLDLGPNTRIRWTNYNKHLDRYQGELERKEVYTKQFLNPNLRKENYRSDKLILLLKSIVSHCSAMRSAIEITSVPLRYPVHFNGLTVS